MNAQQNRLERLPRSVQLLLGLSLLALAAFPLASLRLQKYWAPVARVDNVYGDKNIMCACIPIDAYKEEAEV